MWLPRTARSPPLPGGLERDRGPGLPRCFRGASASTVCEPARARPVSSCLRGGSRVPWSGGPSLAQPVPAAPTSYRRPRGLNSGARSSQFRRPEPKVKVLADGACGGAPSGCRRSLSLRVPSRRALTHTEDSVLACALLLQGPQPPAQAPPQGLLTPRGDPSTRSHQRGLWTTRTAHTLHLGGTKACSGTRPAPACCTPRRTGSRPVPGFLHTHAFTPSYREGPPPRGAWGRGGGRSKLPEPPARSSGRAKPPVPLQSTHPRERLPHFN